MTNDHEQIKGASIWAWIGEDDSAPSLEPGQIGIKQATTPAGNIPLASIRPGQLSQQYIRTQMEHFAKLTGKRRHLVRFRFEAIEETIEP